MTEPVKPGKRPATYEDVLRAPDDKIAEVLAGELFLSPRPRAEHSTVAIVVGGDLAVLFSASRAARTVRAVGGF